MKMPTAIQLAEDLTFIFESARDANEKDPQQPVFTAGVVINLLKNYGFPEPDFKGRGLQITNDSNSDADRKKLRKIGKAIELARKETRMTIAQLAELTGKTPTTVARWESGTANLETSTMLLIEKYLPVKLLAL